MRPIILGIGLLCTVAPGVRAQESAPARPTKVRFGAKVGLTVANTDFNKGVPAPAVPVATKWKPGMAAGFLLQVPVGGAFSLQQEYVFSQLNGEATSMGTVYKFSYLSLPLLLKYALLPRLAVYAGPQFDLLIQASQQTSGATTTTTHDTEERSLGAVGGLDFYLLPNLGLTARYVHGLNHIGIGQRSAVQEFKFESVQVAAEIKF